MSVSDDLRNIEETKLYLNINDCSKYFSQVYLSKVGENDKNNTICIIDDMGINDFDFIFTMDGIIPIRKGKVQQITRYQNINLNGPDLIISDYTYSCKNLNMEKFYKMIQELSTFE